MDILLIILDPSNTQGYPMVGDWLRQNFKADDCYVLSNVWAVRTSMSPGEMRDRMLKDKLVWASTKFLIAGVAGSWAANHCASTDDCFG